MDLSTFELLDCHGTVTHRLQLQFDGRVTIRFVGGPTATVEPRTRTNLTPHITVTPSLMDAAVALTPFA